MTYPTMPEMSDTRFFLYRSESAEGCDYTIACGVDLKPLKARSREEALREIWGSGLNEDDRLAVCCIIEAAAVFAIPRNPARLAEEQAKAAKGDADAKAARKAEFERLRQEFEDDN